MIYLDYNATTPCDPEVLQAMLPYFTEKFGNAGSKTHTFGWKADEAVEQARRQVADLINAVPQELVFTSGATESCNLAIKGVYETYARKGRNHIITCRTEHNAVLDTCKNLEGKGAEVTYLEVDKDGLIDTGTLAGAITERTALIVIMYANNETGVLQPVQDIGAIAKKHKVLFFTDATQAVGKISVDVLEDQVDLLALSAHKIYGPKGVGALYCRRRNPRVQLTEQNNGGGQERGLRSGTLNVPGIVGFGKACSILKEKRVQEEKKLRFLRDTLEQSFLKESFIFVNGGHAKRLPNVSNVAFEGVRAPSLVSALNHQFAFSLGSACTAAVQRPSHVLKAMGLPESRINASVRISIGRFTEEKDIKMTETAFIKAAKYLRDEAQHEYLISD